MDDQPLPMLDADAPACSLDLEELGTRARETEALGEALLARARSEHGHELRFTAGPAARSALERLIAAERECCPFLELTLTESGEELTLTVSTSPEGQQVAEGFVATFGDPRAA
ncbi:MAG TPA: hypothetical protein VIT85_02625 [Solirubrobacterales bacterium]